MTFARILNFPRLSRMKTLPSFPLFRLALALTVGLLATSLATPLRATSVVPPEFDELVGESDAVIRTRVLEVRSEIAATPRGRAIISKVTLEVLDTLVGSAPAQVVLVVLGGRVGNEEMRIEGISQFAVGDEDFLFVQGNGQQAIPLVGAMHGRYPVRRDATARAYVTRDNGVPLLDVAEVGHPLAAGGGAQLQQRQRQVADALSAADFAARIRDAAIALKHGGKLLK